MKNTLATCLRLEKKKQMEKHFPYNFKVKWSNIKSLSAWQITFSTVAPSYLGYQTVESWLSGIKL